VESLRFNEPIHPGTFTIAGTNIPWGTPIVDKITGLNYVYGRPQVYGEKVDLALDAVREAMRAGANPGPSSNEASPNVPRAPPDVQGSASTVNQESGRSNSMVGFVRQFTETALPFLPLGGGISLFLLAWLLYTRGVNKQ
jgi:hypothetical protein